MTRPDVIVAGAGIWGCTVARVLAEAGMSVLVLEKRGVPGGNVRCETTPDGIEVHTYGSHIFHTHIDRVWDFVRRFAEFNGYQHKVLARHDGKIYFLPLGLALVNSFYGLDLSPAELPAFIAEEARKGRAAAPGAEPANFEEQAVAFVGEPLYRAFIREYTRKQWGTDPKNLPASIIRRLPVRANYDINYFPDYRQGIPLEGYNSIFEKLLAHPRIELKCGTPFDLDTPERLGLAAGTPVFYSGPVDALFGYRFGALPWRSLRFETETLGIADFQGASVVNCTDADVPFTRIHEFKHFHPEDAKTMAIAKTVVCREYPQTWRPGDEPYYPVDNAESRALLERYREEAAKIPGLRLGGRLGEYKYYDMDRSIDCAIAAAEGLLAERGLACARQK